ncbi:MAG: hypothetical protein IJ025_01835 [Clostridia bacterium]|nr:hypothetical protein [Clostridia bacterium]
MSFLSSCTISLKNQDYAEVNLNEIKRLQLTYKQNIYDTELQFSRSVLTLTFGTNETAFDGMNFKVTPDSCQVSMSGLNYSFNTSELPENYLPVTVYEFFYGFNETIVTENYDSEQQCCYVSRSVGDSFVRFEVYEHNENTSYTLVIT